MKVNASKSVNSPSSKPLCAILHNADGSPDTTFNTVGYNTTNVLENPAGDSDAHSMAIQQDGKILVAGYSKITNSFFDYNTKFTLVRYNSNGTIDNTFGTNGITRTTVNGKNITGKILTLLSPNNNKIFVIGNANYSTANNQEIAIARYKNDSFLSTNEQIVTKTQFTIYPNPVNRILHFSKEVSEINILDASGRIIFKLNEKTKEISLENLPKGIYYLKAIDDSGEKISHRFVKS